MLTNRTLWRLLVLVLSISLLGWGVACKKGNDEATVTPDECADPADCPPNIVTTCSEDGAYIVRDVTSGNDYSNFIDASGKYVGHLTGSGQVNTTYSLSIDPNPEDGLNEKLTFMLWNVGSKLFIGKEMSDQPAPNSSLELGMRGAITAISAIRDGNDIGIVVGTTHGLAYLKADIATASLRLISKHRFNLTPDGTTQLGVTSLYIDDVKPENISVYLTTTARHVLKISYDAIKKGELGCFDIVANLSGADSLYIPVKVAVVHPPETDKAYAVYLAQKTSFFEVPAPKQKAILMTSMVVSMVSDVNFAIVKAVDLADGKELPVMQATAKTSKDRWVPQDIAVSKDGLLYVAALTYNIDKFNGFVASTAGCAIASSPAAKTACLLADGMFDALDRDGAEAKLFVNTTSVPRILETGVYKYTITKDTEKPFEVADVYRTMFPTNYAKDKTVPPAFLKISYDDGTLAARGSSFTALYTKDLPATALPLITPSNNPTISVGFPMSAAGSASINRYYLLTAVHAFEGKMVDERANGVTEFYTKNTSEDTYTFKKVDAGFGNDAPKLEEYADDGVLYITRSLSDAGKIYLMDPLKTSTTPTFINNGAYLSSNVVSNKKLYCFDQIEKTYNPSPTKISLSCSKSGTTAQKELPVIDNANTVADLAFISGTELAVLLTGRAKDPTTDTFKTYYKTLLFTLDIGDTISISGPTAMSVEWQLGNSMDRIAKIVKAKTATDDTTKYEILAMTAEGMISFKLGKGGTNTAPISGGTATNVLTTGYEFAGFIYSSGAMIDILKDEPIGIEVRGADEIDSTIGTINYTTYKGSDNKGLDIVSNDMIKFASASIYETNAYVSINTIYSGNRLQVIDLSSPSTPTISAETRGSYIKDILSVGGGLFVASGIGGGIEIFQF